MPYCAAISQWRAVSQHSPPKRNRYCFHRNVPLFSRTRTPNHRTRASSTRSALCSPRPHSIFFSLNTSHTRSSAPLPTSCMPRSRSTRLSNSFHSSSITTEELPKRPTIPYLRSSTKSLYLFAGVVASSRALSRSIRQTNHHSSHSVPK